MYGCLRFFDREGCINPSAIFDFCCMAVSFVFPKGESCGKALLQFLKKHAHHSQSRGALAWLWFIPVYHAHDCTRLHIYEHAFHLCTLVTKLMSWERHLNHLQCGLYTCLKPQSEQGFACDRTHRHLPNTFPRPHAMRISWQIAWGHLPGYPDNGTMVL